jgi:hypothetical protein
MKSATLIGLVVMVLYSVAAPALGRRLPPATATRLLVAGNVLVASGISFILAVVAFTWVGQAPEIAELGPWSVASLRAMSPIPAGAAAISTALVIGAAVSVTVAAVRRIRSLVGINRACRGLGDPHRVVALNDARPDAFTTPRPAGRIVVTTGLLRVLDDHEKRAVLAHETAHLTHNHAWWKLAADLSAAANPLLRPAARSIAAAVERWADEDAARTVGDRRLVATTVGRVALLKTGAAPLPGAGPAATDGDVVARVQALLAPAPRRRPLTLVAMVLLVIAIAGPAAAVQHTGEGLFENAAGHAAGPSLQTTTK